MNSAATLATLFKVSASEILSLIRTGQITSVCEQGEGEHAGRHRLTFFLENRRARVEVDEDGQVLNRSVVDFGQRHFHLPCADDASSTSP
jgi:hypothetical protein